MITTCHTKKRITPRLFSFGSCVLALLFASQVTAAVINVRSYGAAPDDSIDDSGAIQRAIDAAPDGSTIYFPKGTYLLCHIMISNRRGLTLAGDGPALSTLKHHGSYSNIFLSMNSTDIVVTKLGFDNNGVEAFGGFIFYNAKRITIAKNHFFDSNKQPVQYRDRYAWVFARGRVPNEDIIISDNLIEDLQLEIDFALRVRVEDNTIVRPVATAGIGIFTLDDYSFAQDYTIQRNTIVDPVVGGGGIVMHLDPPSSSYSTMKSFRIIDNRIVYTRNIGGHHASAIRIGTGDRTQASEGNIFDDIVIQNNVVYKDPGSAYDFRHSVIFGNSSTTANFTFDNTNVSNNLIYYNNIVGRRIVDIRQQGVNYIERNNATYGVSDDVMPPAVPTALTSYVSEPYVHLMWNPSIDNRAVDRYRIYRNGANYGYSSVPSFVDRNVQPGFEYTYTVAAVDLNGNESIRSRPLAVTTSGSSATEESSIAKATLTAGPTTVAAGRSLVAAWKGLSSASTVWVGLYAPGAGNRSYIRRIPVSCYLGTQQPAGSCTFFIPSSLTPDSYELRLIDAAYTSLATSNRFAVTPPIR